MSDTTLVDATVDVVLALTKFSCFGHRLSGVCGNNVRGHSNKDDHHVTLNLPLRV